VLATSVDEELAVVVLGAAADVTALVAAVLVARAAVVAVATVELETTDTGVAAPVVAVSPIVRGQVLKGPTEAFLGWAGHDATGAGVLDHYGALLNGFVADERIDHTPVPLLVTDVDMSDAAGRERVAGETLRFAQSLAR
jgi:hypothetical protein